MKNRVFTVVLAGLVVPVLLQSDPPPIVAAWRQAAAAAEAGPAPRPGTPVP